VRKLLWKVLEIHDGKLVSHWNLDCVWKIGEWKSVRGPLEICWNGFHAADSIVAATNWVYPGSVGYAIAQVEVRGEEKVHGWESPLFNKSCHRSMRVLYVVEVSQRTKMKLRRSRVQVFNFDKKEQEYEAMWTKAKEANEGRRGANGRGRSKVR